MTKTFLMTSPVKLPSTLQIDSKRKFLLIRTTSRGSLLSIASEKTITEESEVGQCGFMAPLSGLEVAMFIHHSFKVSIYNTDTEAYSKQINPIIWNVGSRAFIGEYFRVVISSQMIHFLSGSILVMTLQIPSSLIMRSEMPLEHRSIVDRNMKQELWLQQLQRRNENGKVSRTLENSSIPRDFLVAAVSMYHNKVESAGESLLKANMFSEAISLMVSCCEFDFAKTLLQRIEQTEDIIHGSEFSDLLRQLRHTVVIKEGEYFEEEKNCEKAIKLFCQVEAYTKALNLVKKQKKSQKEMYMMLMRGVPKSEKMVLYEIARYFEEAGFFKQMRECYLKLEDDGKLIAAYLKQCCYYDAWLLSQQKKGNFDSQILHSYGLFLANHNQYDLAQECFSKIENTSENMALLASLVKHTFSVNDVRSASYFLQLISKEYKQVQFAL
eukprot:snap_masked-scaffold_11-processed-gene-0.11-mRNA-1 protein AED:1.00 eAED:1.00 QI:0/0/0/0/1/1/3/0/438